MFYNNKVLDAPNPSYAILDPTSLKPLYSDKQLRLECQPFYQQMKNEGLFDEELPKVDIEELKKEDVPAEVKNDVVMQVEEQKRPQQQPPVQPILNIVQQSVPVNTDKIIEKQTSKHEGKTSDELFKMYMMVEKPIREK